MPNAIQQLRDGVPLQTECDTLLRSAAFREMAAFSEEFLARNRSALAGYAANWGADNPLHSWSRQWEYPYVFGKVVEVVRANPRARILDAGSGATFMPFYLGHRFEETTIACCDTDDSLSDVFASLNHNMNGDVEFSTADIRALPYDDGSFDLVYCVSVLEHTDSYADILHEFKGLERGTGGDHLRYQSGRHARYAPGGSGQDVEVPGGCFRDGFGYAPLRAFAAGKSRYRDHAHRGPEAASVERPAVSPPAQVIGGQPPPGPVAPAFDRVLPERRLISPVRQWNVERDGRAFRSVNQSIPKWKLVFTRQGRWLRSWTGLGGPIGPHLATAPVNGAEKASILRGLIS